MNRQHGSGRLGWAGEVAYGVHLVIVTERTEGSPAHSTKFGRRYSMTGGGRRPGKPAILISKSCGTSTASSSTIRRRPERAARQRSRHDRLRQFRNPVPAVFAALAPLAGFAAVGSAPAIAHEVRPAYLEFKEEKPDVFDVVFKTPMQGDLRLALTVSVSGESSLSRRRSRAPWTTPWCKPGVSGFPARWRGGTSGFPGWRARCPTRCCGSSTSTAGRGPSG